MLGTCTYARSILVSVLVVLVVARIEKLAILTWGGDRGAATSIHYRILHQALNSQPTPDSLRSRS